MAEQKDSDFGPWPQVKKPRSRKDIKKHLRVKYIGTKNKSKQSVRLAVRMSDKSFTPKLP